MKVQIINKNQIKKVIYKHLMLTLIDIWVNIKWEKLSKRYEKKSTSIWYYCYHGHNNLQDNQIWYMYVYL